MASFGAFAAMPAPLHVARPRPWRVEDPSVTSFGSSLSRLRAQCVASFVPNGRRVGGLSGVHRMELEIDGNDARVVSLVHSASHIVERVFRFDAPVLDAVLAQFPRRQRDRKAQNATKRRRPRPRQPGAVSLQAEQPLVVCILSRSDCVSVYAPNGESYEATLPFHADRIFALSPALGGGLLLQRRPLTLAPSAAAAFSPSHARSPPGVAPRVATQDSPPVPRPRYFTLTHPLEEVKPIALSPPRGNDSAALWRSPPFGSQQEQQRKSLAFLSDPALDLVGVCALPGGDGEAGPDGRADDEQRRQQQRGLMVCYHRHGKRFVVYEMTRHVDERSESARGEQDSSSSSSMFSQGIATPGTPRSQTAPFVSPTKARQQQREITMMEQFFKAHIVPDFTTRLVWTTPILDAIADSQSIPSAVERRRQFQRAFLVTGGDENDGEDAFSTGDEIAYRLCILDERFSVLLLKPVRTSIDEDDDHALFQGREDDLRVVRCASASPLVLAEEPTGTCHHSDVATEILLSSRDSDMLFLHSAGEVAAEIVLPDRGSRSDSIQLCASVGQISNSFAMSLGTTTGQREECRRFSHPLQIENSSLLRAAAQVLRYVMPAKDYLKLIVATKALVTARYGFPSQVEYTEDIQWWAFQRVMRATILKMTGSVLLDDESLEHGASKKARATPAQDESTQDDEDADLIRRVLHSEFARTYEIQKGSVVGGMGRIPVNSSSTASRPRGIAFMDHTARDGIDVSAETLGRMLTALHLLHEDMRLSVAQGHAAVKLARLQYELCSSLGLHHLAEYYTRQYINIATSSDPSDQVKTWTTSTTSTIANIPLFFDEDDAAAPDVFLWLRERIQGFSSSARSLGGSGVGSFEPVTHHVSSPAFPRLQGIDDWRRAVQEGTGSSYPLWRTEAVSRVYELLFSQDQDDDEDVRMSTRTYDVSRLTELMEFLTTDEVGRRLALDDLPIGVRFVVLDAIRVYREDPPHDVSELVCAFIGRRDLAGIYSATDDMLTSAAGGTTSGSLIESTRLKAGPHNATTVSDLSATTGAAREVADGLSDFMVRSQRLFPSDQRLKEVARLLRSNRLLCLRLEKTSDMTDQDFVAHQQARLLLLCKRSMALSVARGMVTLGTFDMATVQNQAWQLSVPALPLAGRTPPTYATVSLDVSGYAKELTHWPQFHNGCATGLRLPGKDLSSIVTRYWIKYHRPSATDFQRAATAGGARATDSQQSATATARDIEEAHAAHAGVLLGLGLNGHLKCLSKSDTFNYLTTSNEFVTVAILLGMAATAARSRRKRTSSSSAALQAARRRRRRERFAGTAPDGATQDDGQLPTASQVADTDVDMEVNVPASAAEETAQQEDGASAKALLSAGADVELSLERYVSKMLCLHIPALLPSGIAEVSVPASTQTAALMGLGILYQASGHRLTTELLLGEITRSPASPQFMGNSQHSSASSTPSTTSSTHLDQHEGYSLAAGLALGLVVLGKGGATTGDPGLADIGLEEKLYKYIVGGATQPYTAGCMNANANASDSCLYRGRRWKPFGSGLLGGTIHRPIGGGPSSASRNGDSMKHNSDRSAWRGEHVNIGVTACGSALALALMYIKSGNRSIATQLAVPDTLILLDYVRPDILLIRTLAKNLVLWDSIEPTTTWIEQSEVPKQLWEAYKLVQDQNGDTDVSGTLPDHADVRSICESYANIVAGACFSMGLRFAGTNNASARETLRRFVVYFRDMRSRSALLGGDVVAAATDRVTIERCLTVCAQALALVDAGTGNLETLTLLRSINLRQRVDNELTYGNHMGLSMAIGLLFLGGGYATVSRSNDAIAALVISLYPVGAINTADNKYYLQAFRHLYTLAVDGSRHVETIDTTSGEPCSVELHVERHNEGANGTIVKTTSRFKTPCLLPEMDTIDRIIITNPGFYPVDIRLQDQGDEEGDANPWGGGYGRKGMVRTTANDNRVKLLLEMNRILLERRVESPRSSMVSLTTTALSPLSHDSTSLAKHHDLRAYHQYFVRSMSRPMLSGHQLGDDGAAAWWQQHLTGKQQLPLDASTASMLPTHLGVLYDVFSLHHPHHHLDSLVGLWNLKLIHEFHRVNPFRSLEQRRHRLDDSPGDFTDGAKRDFVEWLQSQTEETLRHRWRHDALAAFPSLTSVQQALLDHDTRLGDLTEQHPEPLFASPSTAVRAGADVLLLSALFVFFDAPPSVYNHPSDWKRRMQRAMAVASSSGMRSSSTSLSSNSSGFALDRFLQLHRSHDDQVTKEEQTFWLRVVTCFLFSV